MKVLLISAYFPMKLDDPARSFVRDEAFELSKAGVDVYVARWRYAGRFFNTMDSGVNGIHVHGLKLFSPIGLSIGFSNVWRLPISLFSLKELGRTGVLFSYGKQVERIVKRNNIDIIHGHFAYPDGFVGSVAKSYTDKPLVISVWGYDVDSDPKIGYGALSRKDTAYLVREALMAADATIVGAESHYKTVIQLISKERIHKVHFIRAGIDTIRFNPNVDGRRVRRELGLRDNQPVVLFARHLEPVYGTEYLIKAIPYMIGRCPNVVVLILGEGPLLADLQRLVDSLKVANHVKFLGQIPKTDMPYYHAVSDIFVDPCIMGQGYAALEALSCGKPVVGFKVGQIKVREGVNGFLVELGDIEGLADRLLQLIEQPHIRKEMGEKGRRTIEKNYSLGSRINDILRIYNSFCVDNRK